MRGRLQPVREIILFTVNTVRLTEKSDSYYIIRRKRMKTHCCDYMDYHANFMCDVHSDPFECPDNLILFDKTNKEYGLIIHDGGSSIIGISFCPWCGKKL
ncbi:DUF6980 family protein [Priestia megaterium]|nr:hypothetical protein [Priestia megaterium]MDH3174489.1 hypothetical protein [Priestia megaterium]